jgi:integrase
VRARARAHVRMEKPTQPPRTSATQRLSCESNPPILGGLDGCGRALRALPQLPNLDIADILPLRSLSVRSHRDRVIVRVDEVVHELDQFDVEEPCHVGMQPLVAALFHREREALLLPCRLARRFAPGLEHRIEHARLHSFAASLVDTHRKESAQAEDAALDAVESRDYAELREFAEIMGLRRRELLLTWPQVDFTESAIRIIGKGGTPAILPLSRRAYEILWALRGNHKLQVFTFVAQRRRVCPKTGTKFVKDQRYPMTYYGIGTNRRRKWVKAGVDARLHDTRHASAHSAPRGT